jgi:nucleoside-diphosphate-sugar epimerase
MARFLVTGGAGFIGSNLAVHLLKAGHSVRVVDDLSTGRRENLQAFLPDIDFIQDTVCDPGVCNRAVDGVEFVLHQAALGSVPRSVEDPAATNHANVTGTVSLLVAAREAGVERFVCAGSSSVYGDTPTLPKVETMTPRPLSPYAVSKLTQEHYCQVFFRVYGLPTVVLRYFNIYGPRQDPESTYAAVIPRFTRALLHGEPAVIYGDGQQTRDFTFIEDCVQANLLACSAPAEALGEVFNIAYGEQVTVQTVFETIRDLLGASAEPQYTDSRPGDVKDSLADTSSARRLLGYQPRFGIRTGLERAMDWYRRHLG